MEQETKLSKGLLALMIYLNLQFIVSLYFLGLSLIGWNMFFLLVINFILILFVKTSKLSLITNNAGKHIFHGQRSQLDNAIKIIRDWDYNQRKDIHIKMKVETDSEENSTIIKNNKRCLKCNTPNDLSSIFCTSCGDRISKE